MGSGSSGMGDVSLVAALRVWTRTFLTDRLKKELSECRERLQQFVAGSDQ